MNNGYVIFEDIFKWIMDLLYSRGVGEGGQGGGTCPPPPLSKMGGGGHKWVSGPPPRHCWAEQMFLFHYLLIFCG